MTGMTERLQCITPIDGSVYVEREPAGEAVAQGARAPIDPAEFPADRVGSPYLAPQVLVDVDHAMRIMREESFGPVVGIMKVASDEEAIARMSDSDFGLTASIWTSDESAALEIGDRVETGTTLSQVGYEQLTRPKSFHLRSVKRTKW